MPRSSRYSNEDIAAAVVTSVSIAEVMRAIGMKPAGGSHFHLSKRIKRMGLDTSHFTGQGHGRHHPNPRKSAGDFLVLWTTDRQRVEAKYLRRSLIEIGRPHVCEGCGATDVWQSAALILHVDHINGNVLDCRPENLRFLCPNCHSQTPTFCRGPAHRT